MASISLANWAPPGSSCGSTILTIRGSLKFGRAAGWMSKARGGGFAAVDRVTTDLFSAVDGADVIIVVSGGNSQVAVARSLAPLVRDGQVILLIQGNTGGSLIVRRALDDAGCRADIDVAEMDNYPYSCWRLSPTRIRPIIKKRWLQIATFPGSRIGAVFPEKLAPVAVRAGHLAAERQSSFSYRADGELRRTCAGRFSEAGRLKWYLPNG